MLLLEGKEWLIFWVVIMRNIRQTLIGFCVLVGAICSVSLVAEERLIKVMALSPKDNRAVVQLEEGKMQVLATGDKLNGAEILQILSDKLVLRNAQGEMVWLLKSKDQQPSEMKVFSTSWPKEEWPKQ